MPWKARRPKLPPLYIPRYSVTASVATAYEETQYLTPDKDGFIYAHIDVSVRDENGQPVKGIPDKRFKLFADSDASGLLDLGANVLAVGDSTHMTPDLTHQIFLYRITFRDKPRAWPHPPGLKAVQYVLMVEPPHWSPQAPVSPGWALISVPVYMP